MSLYGKDRLVVENGKGRRGVYGILLAVLGGLAAFRVVADQDLSGGRIVWVIAYCIVLVVVAFLAVRASRVVVDREKGVVFRETVVLGRTVREYERAMLADAQAVVVETVDLTRSSVPGSQAGRSNFAGLLEPHTKLYRLHIDLGDDRFGIDESATMTEIQRMAEAMSEFLTLPIRLE